MRHLLEVDDLNPSELKKVIALSLADASPRVLDAKGSSSHIRKTVWSD